MNSTVILKKAEFNPLIKTYILLVVAGIMTLTIVGIPIMILWFCGIGQYFAKRYYENIECELSEKTLRFKKGVFIMVEKTIPLENIQDLTFIEGPLLKRFNLAILKLETAGQSNPNGSDMKLLGIIDALDFKQLVLEQREKLVSGAGVTPATTGVKDAGLSEINETLLRIEELLKNK